MPSRHHVLLLALAAPLLLSGCSGQVDNEGNQNTEQDGAVPSGVSVQPANPAATGGVDAPGEAPAGSGAAPMSGDSATAATGQPAPVQP